MGSETTDFRYNTGATKVPWAAVGEDYNAQDLMEIVKFLMQGEGAAHDAALAEVGGDIRTVFAEGSGEVGVGGKDTADGVGLADVVCTVALADFSRQLLDGRRVECYLG